MYKKNLLGVVVGVSCLVIGCMSSKADESVNLQTKYKVENIVVDSEISADGQFESIIGFAWEQPIYKDNVKVGKKLIVDSTEYKLDKENTKAFFDEIEPYITNYKEILIKTNNVYGIRVDLKNNKVYKCEIDEMSNVLNEKEIKHLEDIL